MLPGS